VKKIVQIALGILAAIGGYVDIGDLVFSSQAGASFGYQLIWALPIGVGAAIVFAEMSGRVAAITRRPVMTVVRQRMGFGVGLATLIGSEIVNLMTLAAEVGGLALVLQLLFDFSYPALVLIGVLVLIAVVWFLPFEWIERVFGYGGLLLLVYVVAAVHLHPNWGELTNGFVPHGNSSTLYWYFALGLVAAGLMPYEIYFYSSGAVEERWTRKDLGINRANAILGYALGGLLSLAILVTAAQVFLGRGVEPDFIGTTALSVQVPFGETGLLLALGGILLAVGGAAIDTALSGAYNIAQFVGWEWGKYRRAREAPRFTLSWMIMFALAFLIIVTGIDPLQVTEYSVIFSVVVVPFTYLPVLLIARDPTYMGESVNGRLASFLGWMYMVVIAVVALAAIPLLVATNAGGG
jgi:Mn2+/Fe2+ NRAMP family transporter